MDMVFHPGDYKKKDYPREERIVYDTVVIGTDSHGIIGEPVAGYKPVKRVFLSAIGDSTTFHYSKPIELVSEGIDFSRASIRTQFDESSGMVSLKVVDSRDVELYFTETCQCYEVYTTEDISDIKIDSNLSPHQIVITPILNEDCIIRGYQIRYGDQKIAGCWEAAGAVYERFKKCKGMSKRPRPGKKEKVDWCWVLFGKKCE
jgi:hypothetical protein